MKNFQQMVKQRSFICSCLVTKSRLQMPKAMPTIPEEDGEYEGGAFNEHIYKLDRKKCIKVGLEDGQDATPGQTVGIAVACSSSLSLALAMSVKDPHMELEQ